MWFCSEARYTLFFPLVAQVDTFKTFIYQFFSLKLVIIEKIVNEYREPESDDTQNGVATWHMYIPNIQTKLCHNFDEKETIFRG